MNHRRRIIGKVASNKMTQTVVVEIHVRWVVEVVLKRELRTADPGLAAVASADVELETKPESAP